MTILISCTKKPESEVVVVSDVIKPLELADTTEEYFIDTLNSFITWIGTKPTGRHNGIFRIRNGSLYLANDTLIYGKVLIDMSTIDVLDLKDSPDQYEKLLIHLKSEDLLDIHNHPIAVFELTSVIPRKVEAGGRRASNINITDPNFMVSGNLTLRDSTMDFSFPARIHVVNNKLEGMARFNLNRTHWGINYMNENDPVARENNNYIHNEVNIGLTIIARHKSVNIFQ